MDIQEVNAILNQAIEGLQFAEIEALAEFTIPSPAEMHRRSGMPLPKPEVPTPAEMHKRSGMPLPGSVRVTKGSQHPKTAYQSVASSKKTKPTHFYNPQGNLMDPDKGSRANVKKAEELAQVIQAATDEVYKDFGIEGYSRSKSGGLVTVNPKKKFIAIDIGSSGKLLVGPNNFVWGIKGYGVRHPQKFYGTVDEMIRNGFSITIGGTPYIIKA